MSKSGALALSAVADAETGWVLGETGRSIEGLRQAEAAHRTASEASDTASLARLETQIAWFNLQLGEPQAGIQAALTALGRWRLLRDGAGEAKAGAIYGWLLIEMGLVDEGFSQAVHALTLAGRYGDARLIAFCKNLKAITYLYARQDHLGLPLLQEALAATPSESDKALYLINIAYSHISLSEAAAASNEMVRARALMNEGISINDKAIAVAQGCNDLWNLRTALCNGAEYSIDLSDFEGAERYLRRWENLDGHVGLRERIHYLYTKAHTLTASGRLSQALETAREAYETACSHSHADHKANTAKHLSAVYEAMGRHCEALELYKVFHGAHQAHMGDVTRRRAQFVEMELETEKLRELAASLEQAARRDGLTGLLNRRSLDATLDRICHEKFCLAVVDLDHFKAINDAYSHLVGDETLKMTARILERFSGDLLAFRMGGEEFVLIFPQRALPDAHAISERVRTAIKEADWRGIAPGLSVSASIGLAENAPGLPSRDLLGRADALLYEAKAKGRNTTVSRIQPN